MSDGLHGNGTGNQIDGMSYWHRTLETSSKWVTIKPTIRQRLRSVYYRIKRATKPLRWVLNEDYPHLPTYYELGHRLELEWRIPRDANLEDIFSEFAMWWAEDNMKGDFENEVFRVWHLEDMEFRMIYKVTGLNLEWYKFPFRSSSASRPFTRSELMVVTRECMRSVRRPRFTK